MALQARQLSLVDAHDIVRRTCELIFGGEWALDIVATATVLPSPIMKDVESARSTNALRPLFQKVCHGGPTERALIKKWNALCTAGVPPPIIERDTDKPFVLTTAARGARGQTLRAIAAASTIGSLQLILENQSDDPEVRKSVHARWDAMSFRAVESAVTVAQVKAAFEGCRIDSEPYKLAICKVAQLIQ